MKNASPILNVVLLVAVAVLFYLHFSANKAAAPKLSTASVGGKTAVPSGDFRIAYFIMDSIDNSFAMMKDVREELTKEEEKMTADLTRMQKRYNDKVTQYQSQQNLSQVESEKMNREILQMQQQFTTSNQQMQQRLQDMTLRKRQEVKTKIEDFLTEYNKGKGYSYIMAYEPGFIFYRDSAYNITADLVKGLNNGYKKK